MWVINPNMSFMVEEELALKRTETTSSPQNSSGVPLFSSVKQSDPNEDSKLKTISSVYADLEKTDEEIKSLNQTLFHCISNMISIQKNIGNDSNSSVKNDTSDMRLSDVSSSVNQSSENNVVSDLKDSCDVKYAQPSEDIPSTAPLLSAVAAVDNAYTEFENSLLQEGINIKPIDIHNNKESNVNIGKVSDLPDVSHSLEIKNPKTKTDCPSKTNVVEGFLSTPNDNDVERNQEEFHYTPDLGYAVYEKEVERPVASIATLQNESCNKVNSVCSTESLYSGTVNNRANEFSSHSEGAGFQPYENPNVNFSVSGNISEYSTEFEQVYQGIRPEEISSVCHAVKYKNETGDVRRVFLDNEDLPYSSSYPQDDSSSRPENQEIHFQADLSQCDYGFPATAEIKETPQNYQTHPPFDYSQETERVYIHQEQYYQNYYKMSQTKTGLSDVMLNVIPDINYSTENVTGADTRQTSNFNEVTKEPSDSPDREPCDTPGRDPCDSPDREPCDSPDRERYNTSDNQSTTNDERNCRRLSSVGVDPDSICRNILKRYDQYKKNIVSEIPKIEKPADAPENPTSSKLEEMQTSTQAQSPSGRTGMTYGEYRRSLMAYNIKYPNDSPRNDSHNLSVTNVIQQHGEIRKESNDKGSQGKLSDTIHRNSDINRDSAYASNEKIVSKDKIDPSVHYYKSNIREGSNDEGRQGRLNDPSRREFAINRDSMPASNEKIVSKDKVDVSAHYSKPKVREGSNDEGRRERIPGHRGGSTINRDSVHASKETPTTKNKLDASAHYSKLKVREGSTDEGNRERITGRSRSDSSIKRGPNETTTTKDKVDASSHYSKPKVHEGSNDEGRRAELADPSRRNSAINRGSVNASNEKPTTNDKVDARYSKPKLQNQCSKDRSDIEKQFRNNTSIPKEIITDKHRVEPTKSNADIECITTETAKRKQGLDKVSQRWDPLKSRYGRRPGKGNADDTGEVSTNPFSPFCPNKSMKELPVRNTTAERDTATALTEIFKMRDKMKRKDSKRKTHSGKSRSSKESMESLKNLRMKRSTKDKTVKDSAISDPLVSSTNDLPGSAVKSKVEDVTIGIKCDDFVDATSTLNKPACEAVIRVETCTGNDGNAVKELLDSDCSKNQSNSNDCLQNNKISLDVITSSSDSTVEVLTVEALKIVKPSMSGKIISESNNSSNNDAKGDTDLSDNDADINNPQISDIECSDVDEKSHEIPTDNTHSFDVSKGRENSALNPENYARLDNRVCKLVLVDIFWKAKRDGKFKKSRLNRLAHKFMKKYNAKMKIARSLLSRAAIFVDAAKKSSNIQSQSNEDPEEQLSKQKSIKNSSEDEEDNNISPKKIKKMRVPSDDQDPEDIDIVDVKNNENVDNSNKSNENSTTLLESSEKDAVNDCQMINTATSIEKVVDDRKNNHSKDNDDPCVSTLDPSCQMTTPVEKQIKESSFENNVTQESDSSTSEKVSKICDVKDRNFIEPVKYSEQQDRNLTSVKGSDKPILKLKSKKTEPKTKDPCKIESSIPKNETAHVKPNDVKQVSSKSDEDVSVQKTKSKKTLYSIKEHCEVSSSKSKTESDGVAQKVSSKGDKLKDRNLNVPISKGKRKLPSCEEACKIEYGKSKKDDSDVESDSVTKKGLSKSGEFVNVNVQKSKSMKKRISVKDSDEFVSGKSRKENSDVESNKIITQKISIDVGKLEDENLGDHVLKKETVLRCEEKSSVNKKKSDVKQRQDEDERWKVDEGSRHDAKSKALAKDRIVKAQNNDVSEESSSKHGEKQNKSLAVKKLNESSEDDLTEKSLVDMLFNEIEKGLVTDCDEAEKCAIKSDATESGRSVDDRKLNPAVSLPVNENILSEIDVSFLEIEKTPVTLLDDESSESEKEDVPFLKNLDSFLTDLSKISTHDPNKSPSAHSVNVASHTKDKHKSRQAHDTGSSSSKKRTELISNTVSSSSSDHNKTSTVPVPNVRTKAELKGGIDVHETELKCQNKQPETRDSQSEPTCSSQPTTVEVLPDDDFFICIYCKKQYCRSKSKSVENYSKKIALFCQSCFLTVYQTRFKDYKRKISLALKNKRRL